MLPEQFSLDVAPVASGKAIVCAGHARFTVLTERLIRLEYAPDGQFEDRASQTIWYRAQPAPCFSVQRQGAAVVIETVAFALHYSGEGPFSPENLSIDLKALGTTWHPGDVDTGNLKGTTRTLDFINGYTPLTDGLISRSGWALLDDSRAFVFDEDWLLQPHNESGTDWYFFAYGHDYKAGLRDYCAVSGHMPLIPRWILGNWWSRYWAYTQDELIGLIQDFEAHEIPLSVCIVDMDWHLTETGNDSTGWTGYTWNRALYPDPQALIDTFHARGLHTGLNLHPAEGIHAHEAQYPEIARRMGIDPETKQPVVFDITDPVFVRAYFEVLHHPYEAMGVDFWWVDWQQGQTCKIPGLDPLWLINHLHFQDSGRNQAHRSFIFSRWGNQGHQRYPIGFSGDSYRTWATLRFEPYMTATAANVAYGWWSHDIGGHTSGDGDTELYTRWVQFGVLSPIMRLHSTKGYFYDQLPWRFTNAEEFAAVRDALQLRHALIPYLYTMAWRAHRESLPLILPMYYDYPEDEAAYHCPQQYLFGSELIAAPFVEPADPDTGLSRQVVWLPEGGWYHVFTGEHYEGGWHVVCGTLGDIPLFAKTGAILPFGPKAGWGGMTNPDELHVHAFVGADNRFTLYEDDGDSRDYLGGAYAETTITQRWAGTSLELTIHPAEGDISILPVSRKFCIHIHGVRTAQMSVQRDDDALPVASSYDATTETLSLEAVSLEPASSLTVLVQTDADSLLARRSRKRETVLKLLTHFRLHTGVRNLLADRVDALIAEPDQIAPYIVTMADSQARALCEVLYDAGVQHIPEAHDPDLLILWNNRGDQAITYRYIEAFLRYGMAPSARSQRGVVPRFSALTPDMKAWAHGVLKEHVHRTQWHVQVDYHNLATVIESEREQTP